MSVQLHTAPVAQMDPVTLYRLLRLRVDVFVVEQQCAYSDLDGRDVEPGAAMLWATEEGDHAPGSAGEGAVLATLRVLREPEGLRIGRVVAHPAARGTGVARALMERALEHCTAQSPEADVVLNAQQPLQEWYGSFGFAVSGEPFLEDGIPHVPMRRAGTPSAEDARA